MDKSNGKLLLEQKIEDFSKNEQYYTSKNFNETEVRNRFIDSFFLALGWEFEQTHLPYHLWDIQREYSQKDDSSTKKPDYAFRIQNELKFFVEAKAPHVSLEEKKPIFQAKRYAFSTNGQAPVVILTDFEEFRVFNALERPVYNNPLQGLIKEFDFKYTEYLDKWDLIYDLFSKEAVSNQSLTKFKKILPKQTKTLDSEFLSDISQWRETLAKNIVKVNLNLKNYEINECVQRILDRLIFIRNLEDRRIEPENFLFNTTKQTNIYKNMIPVFQRFNNEYNGILFKKHFSEELNIEDSVIKELIENMCYPISPFQFDIIDPVILGQVYEKFLGSKIMLTDDYQVKIEEKPEVRHAEGVYYTPQYIVNYIVEKTIDKIIKNKSPEEIEKIKILDPSCGSGSFLIGAFDYLIKYHQEYYKKNQQRKYKNDYFETESGEIKITLKKKGEILANNIYGIDIDREASEVAIMSLYLKLLEEGFDKGQILLFLKGNILPDISTNIKCGNSLIDTKFYNSQNLFNFTDGEMKKINAFNWAEEFPSIFKEGGFDCIIGNPPYIRIQELKQWAPREEVFYKDNYISASEGNYDIFVLFVERCLNLLNSKGYLGFILPNKFFNAKYGKPLRAILSKGKNTYHIVYFGSEQVFQDATTYTCLLFLSKREQKNITFLKVKDLTTWYSNNYKCKIDKMDSSNLTESSWLLLNDESKKLFMKISSKKILLKDFAERIFQGFKTGADPVFILDKKTVNNEYFSKELKQTVELEKDLLFPLYKSGNFKRYLLIPNEKIIIFPYNKEGTLIPWKEIQINTPKTANYLELCKNALENREKGIWKNENWYCYSRTQALTIMASPKILTADLNPFANYCEDNSGNVCFTGGAAGGYGITISAKLVNYTLALLNSNLLDWFLQQISSPFRGNYFSYESRFISEIPIHPINFDNKSEYSTYEEITNLVNSITSVKQNFLQAKTDTDKNMYQQRINLLESRINALVYMLYELTAKEIQMIEENV